MDLVFRSDIALLCPRLAHPGSPCSRFGLIYHQSANILGRYGNENGDHSASEFAFRSAKVVADGMTMRSGEISVLFLHSKKPPRQSSAPPQVPKMTAPRNQVSAFCYYIPSDYTYHVQYIPDTAALSPTPHPPPRTLEISHPLTLSATHNVRYGLFPS